MTRSDLRAFALDQGSSPGEFDRMWSDFIAFRELVERAARSLRIRQGTPRFTAFGLVMLEALRMGERRLPGPRLH